jgi:TonB family protein
MKNALIALVLVGCGASPQSAERAELLSRHPNVVEWPEVIADSCKVPQEIYPRDLVRAKVGGDVRVRLLLDETGRVAKMWILERTDPRLDSATAAWLKFSCRFKPARDRAGKAVPMEIIYTFHWVPIA